MSAIVSPASGNGTWTDSVGNSGTFVFFAAVAGLPPRPLPASALVPGSIGTSELAAVAVTGAKVLDGSLTSVDLADAPRAASVEVTSPGSPTTPQVVATVSLTAPAAGTVLVNATGYATIFHSVSVAAFGACSITRGVSLDLGSSSLFGANPSGVSTSEYAPFALTRGFAVVAGPVSVNLVCYRAGNTNLGTINMTAMYVR